MLAEIQKYRMDRIIKDSDQKYRMFKFMVGLFLLGWVGFAILILLIIFNQ